jgi:nucleoside-diphosphate-sugar epimerase
MKILITGSACSIGKYLINYLINTDNYIYCTIRNNYDNLPINKNIEYIKIDLLNENEFYKLPRNIDVIVHLAGVNKFSGFSELEIIRFNVLLNQNIITYANKIKTKKVIYTSSISIYGNVFEKIIMVI